ncbi:hypothetical protein M8494_28600 [Serratia ureilytica]
MNTLKALVALTLAASSFMVADLGTIWTPRKTTKTVLNTDSAATPQTELQNMHAAAQDAKQGTLPKLEDKPPTARR